MSYTQVLTTLSDQAEQAARLVWAQWAAGAITTEEAVAALVAVVGDANAAAAALADLAVAATATARTGVEHFPFGLSPGDESERLAKAAQTLLDRVVETPDPEGRAGRFGRCEPLDTAQRVWGEALERNESVVGWQRGLSAGACQLCQWLEKDGYVYPPERKMHHHTGCRCEQIMVTERTEQ